MATCNKPIASLLDRVSCGVCMEEYNRSTHLPKLLPCQHTFCVVCLTSLLMEGRTELMCPVCRTKHKAPSGGFTTNRAVLDIAEELQNAVSLSTEPQDPISAVPKCSEHREKDCILVCMNCLVCICVECLQQTSHQGHQLKEFREAIVLIQLDFEKHKEYVIG